MTIAAALADATRRLEGLSETPRLDAELLMAHVLDLDRTHLFLALPDPLPEDRRAVFLGLLDRRAAGEPVAYLTGEREFMGLGFTVGPGVLVPRPETELLVEAAFAWLKERPGATIVDVGAGSGAIALSLAALLPADRGDRIVAIEHAPEAMPWLLRNRTNLGLAERVEVRDGDLLVGIAEPVDLLVANLPYLTPEQVAESPSIQAEPREALIGGADGLDLVRRLLADAPRVLRAPAAIILELDPSQFPEAIRIARRHFPASAVSVIDDLAGFHRHLLITIPGYHHDHD